MSLSSNMVRDVDDDMQDIVFSKRGCCFNICCFGDNSKTRLSPEKKVQWWVKGWTKIREWSKVVARSKWKTFNRRFNKNRSIGYRKQGSFHYDARSYAQNFDDGTREKRQEHYGCDFSSRYASVPSSAKSSMDLGKDGPSFTWLLENVFFSRSRVSLFSTKTLSE